MNWYHINFEQGTGTAHIFLRGEIGVGGNTSEDFESELIAIRPQKIELLIDSNGGGWQTGLKLYKILQPYRPDVIITGRCYSSAVLPAMAGKTVLILPNATMMIHSPVNYVWGNSCELLNAAVAVEKLRHLGTEIIRQRTGQPFALVWEWMARDTYFTAAEAIAAGLADAVAEIPAPRPTHRQKTALDLPATPTSTEAEKLFKEWLCAFGQLEVADKEKFGRELGEWFNGNVIQIA